MFKTDRPAKNTTICNLWGPPENVFCLDLVFWKSFFYHNKIRLPTCRVLFHWSLLIYLSDLEGGYRIHWCLIFNPSVTHIALLHLTLSHSWQSDSRRYHGPKHRYMPGIFITMKDCLFLIHISLLYLFIFFWGQKKTWGRCPCDEWFYNKPLSWRT